MSDIKLYELAASPFKEKARWELVRGADHPGAEWVRTIYRKHRES